MKIGLDIKLGIFVVLLFAVVIALCVSWKPLTFAWHTSRLHSKNTAAVVSSFNALIAREEAGKKAIIAELGCGMEEIDFIVMCREDPDGKIDYDEMLDCPLSIAAKNNYYHAARFLIGRGAKLNPGTENGVRPLHYATVMGNLEIVELFIENGADVNACADWHYTPIDCAKTNEVVSLLRAHGGRRVSELKKSGIAER
ncbi:MAG: ankyrin repeat domain-containing protein [Planctomycetota bacterium]|jgi:ankyrin repeat protein